ncbi:hypothetical protein HYH02_006066 [Chlamydomonas schloesseri]|uniref:Uncharacterized protein n=1 Tax=Chlamydomonas schloesseri TaxID=2026947 RepID=A0A835WKY5_9CHLO|nr:hypothetical protein HYH02_006066 [Chlamydomonas schloesseri]|eukprot:KAG2448710.1 hypothetical protein HYH02_006066 [Chlamydomonas schloesseri]
MEWLPCSAASHDASVTTARFGHSAVTISGAGSVWGTDLVVVFGGVSYSDGEASLEHHAALSDVVVLQSELQEQGMWFAPQCSGAADPHGGHEPAVPDARAFHAAAAVDRRMYVFGGHVLSYDPDQNKKRRRFFNDLWCLDTDTWTWQRLDAGPGPGALPGSAPEQPPRRDMATLTRAGAHCLVLFGGRLESGRVAGDAWVLDLHTHTWSQLRIPGPTPPPRKMHAAVFATNRVVIFGGERDAGVLDDLWTLKGVDGTEPAKWTQIRLRPAPSGRFGHAMAACGSRLAVFGGCLDQSSLLSFSRSYVQCNELWVLDMATFSWHRVEPPDGVAAVSAAALDDPQLHHHLEVQQQLAPGASPPLLLLPVERMCHSLVAVGEGRLLLVGGRKRDGICAESWWLFMGPDNLTPALTVPPPATVVAALKSGLHAPPRGAPPASGPGAPHAPGSSAAASSPASAAGVAAPQVPSPSGGAAPASLLQNLLRKSTAAPAPAASAATSAAAVGPAPAAAGPHPGVAHAHSQPHLNLGRGSVSMSGNASFGGNASASGSGAALDAASTSAFIMPGQQQQQQLPPPPHHQHMAGSKSAGALLDPAAAGTPAAAQPPGVASGSGMVVVGSPGGVASPLASASAKERITDKASTALNRLTNKVSNLLTPTKEAVGSPMAAAGGPSGAGSLSTSPATTSGGMSLLSRLRQSSSGQGGLPVPPPHPAAVPPPPPPPPPHSAYGTPGRAASSGLGGAGGSALSPEVHGPLEQLRASLGLAPSASSAAASQLHAHTLPDPQPALAALGQQLAAADGGSGGSGGSAAGAASSSSSAAAVARARRHLACCAAEQLRVEQLPVLLADCQLLLKQRTASAWSGLEEESRRQQQAGGPGPDLGVLAAYVSSCSHRLTGLRPEELRLGDVGELLAAYRSLVLSGVLEAEAGEGGGVGGGGGSGGGGAGGLGLGMELGLGLGLGLGAGTELMGR